MANFITEHRSTVILAAVGAGGILLAGGVAFQIERSRRRDREAWNRELNELRNEICELRHEMELLRMRPSQAVKEGNSGFDSVPLKNSTGDMKLESRASSTISLDSSANYVDALDTWLNFAPSVNSDAGKEPDESLKGRTDSEDEEIFIVDGLLERNEYQQACDYIQKLPPYSRDKSSLLWRYAKACYLLSKKEDKRNSRKENLIKEGKMFASKAYEMDRNNFDALKWLTLLTGAATDYYETRKKIEEGQLFKELLDKALAMEPNDYVLLHLRGRYSYAVANLSWLERTVATSVFRIPLAATVAEALDDFLEVERLKPDSWIDNLLFIAKCYLAKNDEVEAVKYLKKASELAPVDEMEKENLTEVLMLLKQVDHEHL